MITEFVKKWDKYKKNLEDYFRNTEQEEYDTYKEIVKTLFERVINKDIDYGEYDTENMLVIDDGDYQGTQIFILHKSTYKPTVEEYVYTNTHYGSCSGCDTLKSFATWGLPNENQVKDYMKLALHLLQKCKYMED